MTSLDDKSLPKLDEIRRWFASPLGEHVLMTESAILDQLLPGFFGYHLAQFSIQGRGLYRTSPIQNKFTIDLEKSRDSGIVAAPSSIPLDGDSVDVVLLHHLLDFSVSPQEILREISRITIPMGHVVITGFNPFSTWGLWKSVATFGGRAPWNGQFIRPGRLMDWLKLLNFKIDRAQYAIYRPPLARLSGKIDNYSQGVSRSLNLPIGSVYTIVAQKHIGAIKPVKPVWRRTPAFGRLSAVPSVNRDGMTSIEPREEL